MNFYAPLPSEGSTLQQGDLLAGVPFTFFSVNNAAVTLTSGEIELRNLAQNTADVKFIAVSVEFGWGIVLSQTCDLQPDPVTGFARKPIVIARVRPISKLFENFKDGTAKDAVGSIKNLATPGKSPTVLYLPAYEARDLIFPKSGANLLDVQRILAQDLPDITPLLRLRLQDAALQALQERCAYCFGRFGAPDDLYYSDGEWAEIQRSEEERRKSQKQ